MQSTDALSRGRSTLKYFTRPSLVGDLCTELESTRAEAAYWQERAMQAERESAAARAEAVRLMRPAPSAPRPGFWARLKTRTQAAHLGETQ